MTDKKKATVWTLEYHCPKCNSRMAREAGIVNTDPPRYPHRCVVCNHGELLEHKYPRLVWEEGEAE